MDDEDTQDKIVHVTTEKMRLMNTGTTSVFADKIFNPTQQQIIKFFFFFSKINLDLRFAKTQLGACG